LLDLIASFAVRELNRVFHVTPIKFNLWLGKSIGSLVYLFSGKRNRVAYANIKAAFCGEKTPQEMRRITRGVYKHAGQTFAEILSMTKVDKCYIDKYVHIENFERIVETVKNSKGTIFITAHFGNWELSAVAGAFKGFPLYLLARDQKMERLNELLNLLRESKGNMVVRKGFDVKNIFRLLREGKSVAILADQNAGASGDLIDFFGRPASAPTGPYRFAQKSGAWILPLFIHRIKGPYHEVVLERPMVIKKGEDVSPYMREYNHLLEKHIRDFPEQWLWMHKRWKATSLKKVMVLDDGKKGHLKQSLAVASQIKRFRVDEGFPAEKVEINTVKIRYKNRMARVFLNMVSPFITYRFQWHLKCLKSALAPESYENAVNRHTDIIVSCGSSLSSVNRILKMENSARNVIVLDPGPLLRNKFDLVVIPRHDVTRALLKRENVVVTDLAPNLIDPAELSALKEEIERKEDPEGKALRIGLLIGGDNMHFTFEKPVVDSVVSAVRTACGKTGARLNVTTSRRTPDAAEDVIKSAFQDIPFCDMFVSGKNDTDGRTVEKIMAMSDVVIVSGESISMVSEAVSSGRQVVVFLPAKRSARFTKYERFAKELQDKRLINLVKPEDIPGEVERLSGEGTRAVLPEDNKRIYEKLYKLF